MKARPFFVVIAAAFLAWLVVAVRVGAGDPTPTTSTSGPEPSPAPPPDPRVATLTRQLQLERRARRRERFRYRHALLMVIRRPEYDDHWVERGFRCIHGFEGRWSSNTGNGYFGGLQMDATFQRTYAPWAVQVFGTADRWPRSVQIATAIRAWVSRGFYPWPNTARACGLIR